MNLPITSRIKRSPLLKKSGPGDEKVTYGEVNEGEDKEITTTKNVKGAKVEKLLLAKDFEGGKSNPDYIKKKKALDTAIANGADEKYKDKKITTKEIVKGKKSVSEGTAKIETRGDVFNPWETRSQSRSIKKEQRDIRRAKIKAARKNGTLTSDKRKQYKAEEAEAELKAFEAMSTRNSKSRASGRVGGTDVRTGERDMTMSEISGNEASIQAQKKNRAAKDKRDNITTANSSSANSAVNPDSEEKKKNKKKEKKTIASSGQAVNAPGGSATQAPQYNYGAAQYKPSQNSQKRSSAFPKKKNSPYKMKGSTYNK
jgi:hypothetical protein